MLRLGVRNAMLLTPRNRYFSQGCITIPVPRLGHPIRLNPIFEPPERSSTTDGVTQIISQVVLIDREADTLHHMIFIDLTSVGQREIVLRFHNVPSDTNRVVLPVREVFEGCVVLRSTSFLVGDGDDVPSGQVEQGGPFIRLEFQTLNNVREFDP
jgi:hypothetical protein